MTIGRKLLIFASGCLFVLQCYFAYQGVIDGNTAKTVFHCFLGTLLYAIYFLAWLNEK